MIRIKIFNIVKAFLKIINVTVIISIISLLIIAIRGDNNYLKAILTKNRIFSNIIKQREEAVLSSKLKTLDYYQPNFKYLISINSELFKIRNYELQKIDIYYRKLLEFFPAFKECYSILGVANYYLGDKYKALEYLEQSTVLAPDIFLNWYNLGVYYVNQGDKGKALEAFDIASTKDINLNVSYILRSRIFQQIGFISKVNISKLKTRMDIYHKNTLRLREVISESQINDIINIELKLKMF